MSVKQDKEPSQVAQAKKMPHQQMDKHRILQAKTRLTMLDNRHDSQQIKQLKATLDEEELSQHQSILSSNPSLTNKAELPLQAKSNTGLPDNLKSGMENLSGMSLNHVKVHYNSSKPAAVQAHAFAQGSDIHVGSGQEKHLSHELGHVVQQAQGRVKATTTVNGLAVNDSRSLEHEATAMGAQAESIGKSLV